MNDSFFRLFVKTKKAAEHDPEHHRERPDHHGSATRFHYDKPSRRSTSWWAVSLIAASRSRTRTGLPGTYATSATTDSPRTRSGQGRRPRSAHGSHVDDIRQPALVYGYLALRDRGRHSGFPKMIRDICEDWPRGTPMPRGLASPSVSARALPDHLRLSRAAAVMAHGGDPDHRAVERTFRNLKRRSDKTAVAKSIRLTAPVLESWMHTYARMRNICAHHGRLWNVGSASIGLSRLLARSPD